MKTADFDYLLPPELIAQHPPAERSGGRLLYVDGDGSSWGDRVFRDLPSLVSAGDLLIFNDTKVVKARLYGRKDSGGAVEVLIERVLDSHTALAHLRASKSPKADSLLHFAGNVTARMLRRVDDLFELSFDTEVYAFLEQHGEVPLPPYISHAADADDETRYQTVYARERGSVAAPTAGLHFDTAMLAALRAKGAALAYVTLHVGAGTFRPVRDEEIAKHVMHLERYEVPAATVTAVAEARACGGKVIAVGTTSLRTLESAAADGTLRAGSGETRLFITPGYRFKVVDRLVTNFHLPKSTLLMLVSAFAGHDLIMRAYRHAVEQRYRFFSYGDAMLLERATDTAPMTARPA
ncbi:MAG: tRNA preQ1(34) S-adenosylmethionine ribosyltransferase-isomerase QueA [Betaproteobacteria bacterium]|nr:tRNA preQ1(34) S-adenosylmethionine ribosyltransferase-isomerase QueA [Betaproteobacteria bacterium]